VNLGQWREQKAGAGGSKHIFDHLPAQEEFPASSAQLVSMWTVQDAAHLSLCRPQPIASSRQGNSDAAPASQADYAPIDLSRDEFSSTAALEALGLDHLKAELDRRGLKCSGTLEQRAARLFSIRNLPEDQIPHKLKKK
jgi:hypothetical protein